MLNRDPRTLGHYWAAEDIPKPQASYGLTEHQQEYQYFWREEDILQLHEYCLTVHIGRPRKDKFIRTKPMPSRTELLAMLRHDTILYVKTDSGEFTPAWKEPEWQ